MTTAGSAIMNMLFMSVKLRKIRKSDIRYFKKWWRDAELIALTSGDYSPISDIQVREYFNRMCGSKQDLNYMIVTGDTTVGHISLNHRRRGWHETQIVIGNRNYWGKGIGTKAIQLLLRKAARKNITRVYLEVRPDNNRAIAAYTAAGFMQKRILKTRKKNLPSVLRMTWGR